MARDLLGRLSESAREYYRAVVSDGVVVERLDEEHVVESVRDRLVNDDDAALAVLSVNVDHLHHFAPGKHSLTDDPSGTGIRWMSLADGAPIAARAGLAVGAEWPRVTGADLLPKLLSEAEAVGATVGFLGGTPEVHENLRSFLQQERPGITDVHFWAPDRSEVDSLEGARGLARDVREARVDLLCVAFGKPRQELWIERFGAESGCKVLLAFGASADFIAGKTERAPEWARSSGFEWMYRLAREPRRLAKRYLLQGPVAATRLIRAIEITHERRHAAEAAAKQKAAAGSDAVESRHPRVRDRATERRRASREAHRTQEQRSASAAESRNPDQR